MTTTSRPQPGTDRTLQRRYDVAVLDLDGVVYIGDAAVSEAVPALTDAAASGMRLAYVTNNASRTTPEVAEQLRALGLPAGANDVVTSAQAAARLLRADLPPGSAVFVIGGPGIEESLRECDLRPVTDPDEGPVAVVQGFGPDMPWRRVVAGAILVRQGLPWVATNTDLTFPTSRGPGPGNGALVELVARHSGRHPVVAGKPEPPLFETTRERIRAHRPLVVGDRVDTDIAGARAVAWDSLLVMTGVTELSDLLGLTAEARPTYVGADLTVLATATTAVEPAATASCGGWRAWLDRDEVRIAGSGDRHAWWQAVATVAWRHVDRTGVAPSCTAVAGSVSL